MAATRAANQKRMRQDALREQLRAQGHLQHVVDMVDDLRDIKEEMDSIQVQRISKAIDAKLRIVNKYLPDEKYVEVTGATDDDGLPTAVTINIVKASD